DSINTAFCKDMQYERLLFDFYVETGGSRFAGGLANFTNAPLKRRIELEDEYSLYAFSDCQLLDIIRSSCGDRAL
ncbi:hypothetical protein L249_4463, partial [Ophiocordyceps polyrhachis-furcata BCC 54312]